MLMVSEAPRVMRTDRNFIVTFTGRKFWPLDPRPEEIDIQDIAHALSLVCRWTGHTYRHYSVAEHSLRVSKLAEQLTMAEHGALSARVTAAREIALWGLLHDASEAYLSDFARPLKHFTEFGKLYSIFEEQLTAAIVERFDLMPHRPSVVRTADRVVVQTEGRDLIPNFTKDMDEEPLPEAIFPMNPQRAEVKFLRRFNDLSTARMAERAAETPSPRKAS